MTQHIKHHYINPNKHYLEKYGTKAIPMFIINPKKRLQILSGLPKEEDVLPGSKVVALVKADRVSEKIEEKKQEAARS